MKKVLIILFSLLSINAFATTIYYVSTTGNDISGDGSSINPWATGFHACATVLTPGDIIHIEAGTYTESSRWVLAIGVNLEGVDTSSTHIKFNYYDSSFADGAIYLSSAEGTNGNQSISNIWLDGNGLTSFSCIMVWGRSNVHVHNVKISDFIGYGISFNGRTGTYGTPPAIYSTGNQLYNSHLSNCGDRNKVNPGLIIISGQSIILIHDNILENISRAQGHNGNIIYAIEGNNEGIEYYNNKSYKPMDEGSQWNMHIESWNTTGGNDVYNNEFHGGGDGIDAAEEQGSTNVPDNFSYGWHIYDNLFIMPNQMPTVTGHVYCGIVFEGHATNSEVDHNHFVNLSFCIQFSTNLTTIGQSNMKVHNNLMENIGYADNSFSQAIYLSGGSGSVSTERDIYVDNNTIIGGTSGHILSGFYVNATSNTVRNAYFRNNIIENAGVSGSYGYLAFQGTGVIDSFFTQNNIPFNNINSNTPYLGITPTHFVNTGNIITNPLLNSDYTLTISSPARGAGIDGSDIGAFPYVGPAQNNILILHNGKIVLTQ